MSIAFTDNLPKKSPKMPSTVIFYFVALALLNYVQGQTYHWPSQSQPYNCDRHCKNTYGHCPQGYIYKHYPNTNCRCGCVPVSQQTHQSYGQTSGNVQKAKLDVEDYSSFEKPPLIVTNAQGDLTMEDDIIVDPHQKANIEGMYGRGSGIQRNLISNTMSSWKDTKRGKYYIIPYRVDGSLSHTLRPNIPKALEEIRKHTCIRFVARTNERNYINFQNGMGCSSYVGRVGGGQRITLASYGCHGVGVVMHEVLHALGFFHEQSRADRDKYVRINLANVKSSARGNFEKRVNSVTYNSKYDFNSIMHYRLNQFAINPSRQTIIPIRGTPTNVGQRTYLSEQDIYQLRQHYPCDDSYTPPKSNGGTKPTAKCRDRKASKTCQTYRRRGFCSQNKKRARSLCPMTCGACQTQQPAPGGIIKFPSPATTCRDTISSCVHFTKFNLCQNPRFISFSKMLCRRTCKFC